MASLYFNMILDDVASLPTVIEHFESEYDTAKNEIKLEKNKSIVENSSSVGSQWEHRFSQLQEIEAILEHFNIQLSKTKSKHYRNYTEHYKRQLSSRDVEKYVEGEEEVVSWKLLINQISLIRNKYLSLSKGYEAKNFQLNNIVKLKQIGLDDATI